MLSETEGVPPQADQCSAPPLAASVQSNRKRNYIDSIDIKALAGGDKPPPLRMNHYLKSSGGVYPRQYLVPVKKSYFFRA
jgi:hypothetical protein